MKILTLSNYLYLMVALLFLATCNNNNKNTSVEINTPEEVQAEKAAVADIADAAFVDGMTGKVFHNYLRLRRSLVAADVQEAQKASSEMAEAFGEERTHLKELAEHLSEATDIEVQRTLFSRLTVEVETLFREGLSGGTIYKLHCPMAFDNTGANWFSDVPEIENPYFGDRMLRCGKVVETLGR
jgi:hypothetical protein